jgi:hypothetical protein|tara:strand:- start:1363 stop:1806 length:444 start_codon:yes stop_codon:yes gene_type:complete
MPPKYEYKKIVDTEKQTYSESETLLNSYGNDGWELVSAVGYILYFKRELQQEPQEPQEPQVDETDDPFGDVEPDSDTDEHIAEVQRVREAVQTAMPARISARTTASWPQPVNDFSSVPAESVYKDYVIHTGYTEHFLETGEFISKSE